VVGIKQMLSSIINLIHGALEVLVVFASLYQETVHTDKPQVLPKQSLLLANSAIQDSV